MLTVESLRSILISSASSARLPLCGGGGFLTRSSTRTLLTATSILPSTTDEGRWDAVNIRL